MGKIINRDRKSWIREFLKTLRTKMFIHVVYFAETCGIFNFYWNIWTDNCSIIRYLSTNLFIFVSQLWQTTWMIREKKKKIKKLINSEKLFIAIAKVEFVNFFNFS